MPDNESISANPGRAKVLRGFLIALWVVAVSVELYFLLHDVAPGPPSTSSEDSVAELLSVRRSVHRQRPGELPWYESGAGDLLLHGESVLTLEESGAEVGFNDGSALVLGENTLVRIERPGARAGGPSVMTVTLLRGNLGRRTGRPSPGREAAPVALAIRAGEVEVEASPDAELSVAVTPEFAAVQVRGGSADVRSSTGRARATAGEAVTVAKAGTPRVTKIEVAPVAPADGAAMVIPEGRGSARVKFSYSAQGAGPGRVEVAHDREFGRVAASIESRGGGAEWEAPAGHWYWRAGVKGPDGRWAWSAPSRLVVEEPPALEAFLPAQHARRPVTESVEFAWSPSARASAYELRIRPEGGAAPTVLRSERPFASAGPLPAGTYLWEALSIAADGSVSARSPARTLTILEAEEEALAPPSAASLSGGEFIKSPNGRKPGKARRKPAKKPRRGGAIFLLFGAEAWAEERPRPRLDAASDLAPRTWKVRLSWEAVAKAAGYRVQVARDEAFSDILADGRVDSPEYLWIYQKGLEGEGGRVYYRVASVTRKGKEGRFSDARAVPIPEEILAGTAPTDKPVEVYSAIEETEPPKPARVPPVAREPAPAKPVAVSSASPPAEPFLNGIRATLGLGWGSLAQSSAASGLSSVALEAPYLSSRAGADAWLRPSGSYWSAHLEWEAASFDGPTEGRTTLQQRVTAHAFRVAALRWPGGGAFGWGGALERSYRWVKTAEQTVSPDGAVSFGPSFALDAVVGGGLAPRRAGASLDLPLTGALTGGALGAAARAWAEWGGRIGARAEADFAYRRWSDPESTSVTDWRLWVALSYGGGRSR